MRCEQTLIALSMHLNMDCETFAFCRDDPICRWDTDFMVAEISVTNLPGVTPDTEAEEQVRRWNTYINKLL